MMNIKIWKILMNRQQEKNVDPNEKWEKDIGR